MQLRLRERAQLPLPADPALTLSEDLERRVALTVSCRDADEIPKVGDAGRVRDEDGVTVQVMHEGSRIVAGCYYGAFMTEIIRRLRGHHEPQEEIVVHRIIERLRSRPTGPRGAVIVELGSFWAYYSLWAMRALEASAILVEPDPANREAGRLNLELNGRNGRILEAAVGGEHGDRLAHVCESDGITREVPVVTVAGLMADEQVDDIDLLVVDVQGGEVDVLTRAIEVFAGGHVRFAVISTHHHAISGDPMTHQQCRELVAWTGGHVIAEHSVGESFSGDGLIAASWQESDQDLVVPISYARYRDSLYGELEPELARAQAEIAGLS